MELKIISKLPSGSGIIGVREIQKGIKSGTVNYVVVAKNCPDWLLHKITNDTSNTSAAGNVQIVQFDGNERELGTIFGKAFAIAMVGFKE